MSAGADDQWAAVTRLFEALADLPPERQAAELDAAAARDPALRDTVARMLNADRAGDDLLGSGIAQAAWVALREEAPLTPGTRVGAFDVVGELGRGGMGIVYAAVDRHLGRPAALKLLPADGDDAAAADRLLAEAKAASALDHPNVATVYQVGETDDGRRFIAMARYDGETLRERLARGPVSAAEALRIARQVAAGLEAAHAAGIVHRDVSPGNIFLAAGGPVKLLDFGIAALSGAASAPVPGGTPDVMSPEQARGEAPDPRSDVWALGSVLYRMLTGAAPVRGATGAETVRLLAASTPAAPLSRRVPRRLRAVVRRALSAAPEDRYADAGALRRALDEAATAPRRWRVAAAGLLACGFLAALGLVMRPAEAPHPLHSDATLAVLPAPATGDSAGSYLVEGLVEELTSRLARLRRLRVKGPRAAAAVLEHDSPQQIGAALGVDYLLQTRVARRDSLIEIGVRLLESRNGYHLWSADYAGTAADLLALQDSIAREVAGAMGGELSERERATLAHRMTTSPVAYDRYLRGSYLLGKRTPAAVGDAIREFGVAVGQDPRFAEAFAGMAYAQLLFVDWGWQDPERSAGALLADAEQLVERAMEIDPGSAAAWLARAYLHVVRDPLRFDGAVPLFERALALDSLDPEAYHQYGQTLMALGRYPEAASAYGRALALDPARPMTLVPLAAIALQQGRDAEARRWADSAVAVTRLVPAPYALAVRASVRLQSGDFDGAVADARRAHALDSSYAAPALSVLTVALQRSGDTAATSAVAARLLASFDPTQPSPTDARFAGSALFALGRGDDALRLIEAARPRGALLWFYLNSRDFHPYHHEPRLAAVLAASDPRPRHVRERGTR